MAELKINNISPNIFTFKKLTSDDWPLLLRWFKEPHVEKWWPTPQENELKEYFLKKIGSKSTFGFIVSLHGISLGYVQYYYTDRSTTNTASLLLPLHDKRMIGMDQFIGDPDYLHQGYGTLFIKQFIKELPMIEPQVTTIIVDPHEKNIAAIKCYEKVGFIPVGNFENTDGTSLIMRYDIKTSIKMKV